MQVTDLDGVRLELVVGDITAQADVAAVVNAANAQLAPGGGVAGAIHAVAGPQLFAACQPLAPIDVGEAVITPGFALPNAHVIHVLGPRYGIDEPAADLLAACYREALHLADRQGLDSVAFPAVSTGAFGYPADEAAAVALTTVREVAPKLTSVERVRFVLFDHASLAAHEAALRAL